MLILSSGHNIHNYLLCCCNNEKSMICVAADHASFSFQLFSGLYGFDLGPFGIKLFAVDRLVGADPYEVFLSALQLRYLL